jgi:hypothetical protein
MKTADRVSAWIETQYCASVAATLQARAEYFELLEDAMTSPVRLLRAFSAWRKHASQAEETGCVAAGKRVRRMRLTFCRLCW